MGVVGRRHSIECWFARAFLRLAHASPPENHQANRNVRFGPLGYGFIMRRRCDRNRLGSIAAVLSILSALLVVHQIQAKNASRVSWISTTAFSPKPLKLASYKEIDENSSGTINSVDGSGGEGCGMSPEEFAKFYPPLVAWIRNTLAASAPVAQTVASRGF